MAAEEFDSKKAWREFAREWMTPEEREAAEEADMHALAELAAQTMAEMEPDNEYWARAYEEWKKSHPDVPTRPLIKDT